MLFWSRASAWKAWEALKSFAVAGALLGRRNEHFGTRAGELDVAFKAASPPPYSTDQLRSQWLYAAMGEELDGKVDMDLS